MAGPVFAEKMKPGDVYRRCYSQIVRRRQPASDPLFAKVVSGEMAAAAACTKLVEHGTLNQDGRIDLSDPLAQPVLRTFQSLHSSWFPNHDFVRDQSDYPTSNQHDSGEMGYHFTWLLLRPGEKFSSLVTRPTSWRGVRTSNRQATHFLDSEGSRKVASFTKRKWGTSGGREIHPLLVETGTLIGIAPMPKAPVLERQVRGVNLIFDPIGSHGAGILGTQAYLLLSSPLKVNAEPDGGMKVHRSWSKAVLSDLLCRSLPVIREADVRGLDEHSPLPFRHQTSCLKCHSTMDPMAGAIRNVEFMQTIKPEGDKYFHSLSAVKLPMTDALGRTPAAATPYARSRAEGALYLRDYRGRLVDLKFEDLSSLGQGLADLDDFYLCAAKRYFDFFTGIDVQIRDFSEDPPGAESSPLYKYRDFVIGLGADLKRDQSLPALLGRIFASRFYQSSSYGVAE